MQVQDSDFTAVLLTDLEKHRGLLQGLIHRPKLELTGSRSAKHMKDAMDILREVQTFVTSTSAPTSLSASAAVAVQSHGQGQSQKKEVHRAAGKFGAHDPRVAVLEEEGAEVEGSIAAAAPAATAAPVSSSTGSSAQETVKEAVKGETGKKKLLPHAGNLLQEAADLYRAKSFQEACDIYGKILLGIPARTSLPTISEDSNIANSSSSSISSSSSRDNNNKSSWKKDKAEAEAEAQGQGLALLRAVTLSGRGSCLTALTRYDEGISSLEQSKQEFLQFVATGLLQHKEALAGPENGNVVPRITQEQICTTAKHAWSDMDNIMECHARRKHWGKALCTCKEALQLCEDIVEWTRVARVAMQSAADVDDEVRYTDDDRQLSELMKRLLQEARQRQATTRLAAGHILKDMLAHRDSAEGGAACKAHVEAKSKSGIDDRDTHTVAIRVLEDCVEQWDMSAAHYSALGANERAANAYSLAASVLQTEACKSSNVSNYSLEPYFDWVELNQVVVDGDYALQAHAYYDKEAREAMKASTSVERELREIALAHKKEGGDGASKVSKGVSKELQEEITSLQQERMTIFQRILAACLNAAIAAFHGNHVDNCLTDAERSLDLANQAHKDFTSKIPIEKFLGGKNSESWRNFHALVADCQYHAALAYFRLGKLDYCLEYANCAVLSSAQSQDRSRMQYALGLRSLAHSVSGSGDVKDAKTTSAELAEADIIAAGATSKLPVDSPDFIMQTVRKYVQRYLPKGVSSSGAKTPQMMPLAEEDKKRKAARDVREAAEKEKQQREEGKPKNFRIEPFDEFGNTINLTAAAAAGGEESFPERLQAFLTGDGTLNLIVAWSVVIAALAVVMASVARLLEQMPSDP